MQILFEDSSLLAVNKAAGCITEGPVQNGQLSLEASLTQHLATPIYACHRLDRDTTGVLVFAKTKPALRALQGKFSKGQVRKAYFACVQGEWKPAWNRVETYIQKNAGGTWTNGKQGKLAITTFRRLAYWEERSVLQALLKTGRTHQIRLHCAFQGCPIAGDGLYGHREAGQPSMALHASELRLTHPDSGESLTLKAQLPDFWQDHWLNGCPAKVIEDICSC